MNTLYMQISRKTATNLVKNLRIRGRISNILKSNDSLIFLKRHKHVFMSLAKHVKYDKREKKISSKKGFDR